MRQNRTASGSERVATYFMRMFVVTHTRSLPLAVLFACLLPLNLCLASLPVVAPAKVSMAPERLAFIDKAVGEAVERKETPGAVVLVARRGGVVWRKAYGSRRPLPPPRGVNAEPERTSVELRHDNITSGRLF